MSRLPAPSALWSSRIPLPITSVVAVTPQFGIGQNNLVPWQAAGVNLANDMHYFRQCTSHTNDSNKRNVVVMGRRTWEGIPERNRPLKDRINIVLSCSLPEHILDASQVISKPFSELLDEVQVMRSLDHVLNWASEDSIREKVEKIVVIGGADLFEDSFFHPWFSTMHITFVQKEFACDTFLSDRLRSGIELRLSENPLLIAEHIENDVPYR